MSTSSYVTVTQEEIDDLAAAIKGGELAVGHGPNRVQYRSLAEMRQILEWMISVKAEQDGKTSGAVFARTAHRRGHH